jgi:glyoxylase-like metal-dependent hydrolase (beta-lactamase superfamily II)
MTQPIIDAFFDEATYTVTYLVTDPETRRAAIIDPVLDYDHKSGKASARSADGILAKAAERHATVDWILETHAHADHLTAAPLLKARTGAKVVIGEHIRDVQKIFKAVFNAADVSEDGSEFDRLVRDGEILTLGSLRIEVLHLPGHTPADVAYRIGNAVFVGDTIFMPDYGTARADFPGGDAATLYRSIHADGPRAAPALGAGEYPGRSSATAGRQRPQLPQDSGHARHGMTIGRAFRSR